MKELKLTKYRKCRVCYKYKLINQFVPSKNYKSNYSSICISCNRQRNIDNPQWKIKRRIVSKKAREQVTEEIRKYKNRPCMDCGIKYPHYVLDLDHRDPTQKEYEIGDLKRNRSVARIKRELPKCDVVCSNCHRERTHQRKLKMSKENLQISIVRTPVIDLFTITDRGQEWHIISPVVGGVLIRVGEKEIILEVNQLESFSNWLSNAVSKFETEREKCRKFERGE